MVRKFWLNWQETTVLVPGVSGPLMVFFASFPYYYTNVTPRRVRIQLYSMVKAVFHFLVRIKFLWRMKSVVL